MRLGRGLGGWRQGLGRAGCVLNAGAGCGGSAGECSCLRGSGCVLDAGFALDLILLVLSLLHGLIVDLGGLV